jgi:putative ABC transport system permease protein
MKPLSLYRIAGKALLRNKFRTFLTMLGVIIGVASVISMVAIGEGSKQSIQRELSSMGSNMITIRPSSNTASGGGARLGAGALQILKVDDVEAIEENAILVTAVSPVVSTGGQAINAALNWPTAMHGGSTALFRNTPMEVT